ncbi:MAG: ornithine--oxo-acid transaminase [Fimbriimonadaceae bacterium]|nr:ornithine--oxo-acid transaminase [Chthonomonadaceae bacterium]MCO5297289.1 ornithine--oxo-acid transaminase [Fimbriimonadaceae bacterium]
MRDDEVLAMTERYGTHNYHPLPVNIVRGEGLYVWDGSDKRYFDCIGSYSAVANGHASPAVVAAAKAQLEKLTLTSRAVYTTELALFLKRVCEYTGTDMACPMNTGAEAVETAIKLARKWAYSVKGIEPDNAEILVAKNNFHGRTTTIVGFSTEAQYRDLFGPYGTGFKVVEFGNLDAVEAAITPNTCAVLMEPIQAEAGILFPPEGFMAGLRRLCDKHNVLLVWDEIQTGFCRTGKKFAWQHEDAEPDLMCLGKALGGGVLPVSAVVGKRKVMEVFEPGDHGSTFGGNPLACSVAVAAMDEMDELDLAANSACQGKRMVDAMRAMAKGPLASVIQDVRGRGLLVGLEVRPEVDTQALQSSFLKHGVLTKETRSRTFRFAPPLILDDGSLADLLARVERALTPD